MEARQKSGLQLAVTAENYQELGSSFIRNNGGFVIALADGINQGVEYRSTPRQWGAWLAYFKARGIKTVFMTVRGQSGKCWTVPAEWPHEFDSQATVQGDYAVGEAFLRNYRPPQQKYADAAARLAHVRRWRETKANQQPEAQAQSHARTLLEAKDFHSSADLHTPSEFASDELLELVGDVHVRQAVGRAA